MAVAWTWAGAQSDDGFTVTASLGATGAGSSCVLVVSTTEAGLSDPDASSDAVTADTDGYAKMTISGLAADTRWWYGVTVDDDLDDWHGRCRTFPTDGQPASFRVAFGCCTETKSEASAWYRVADRDPLMFLDIGDFAYWNYTTNDQDQFRTGYETAMSSTARSAMMSRVGFDYMWDNHDFGPPSADHDSATRPAAANVYRQIVPSYDLPGTGDNPIYHDFRVGRVPFIVTDEMWPRTAEGVNDDTSSLLGAAQLAWFKQKLLDYRDDGAPVIFWCSELPWYVDNRDQSWGGGYSHEQSEITDFITAHPDLPPIVLLSGNVHGVAYHVGTVTDDKRMLSEHVCSGLDQQWLGAGLDGNDYTAGPWEAVDFGGFYALIDVHDDGESVSWTVTAWKSRSAIHPDINLYVVNSDDPGNAPTLGPAVARTWDGTAWRARPVQVESADQPLYAPTT